MRRETFETPGELTLDVHVPAGRIEIETVDATTTEVELDARGSSDQVAELLEDARIELREVPGGHELSVDVEGWLAEVPLIKQFFDEFGDRLPTPMKEEVTRLEERLRK